MPSTTWLGPGNTALLGPEMRPETGLDVMEMVANSSSDRRQVGRQKDPQRSSVTHGSKPLAGIDGRSARVRRFESNISDLGGETLQCRQRHRLTCPCLNRPLERLEAKFALAGGAKSSRGRGDRASVTNGTALGERPQQRRRAGAGWHRLGLPERHLDAVVAHLVLLSVSSSGDQRHSSPRQQPPAGELLGHRAVNVVEALPMVRALALRPHALSTATARLMARRMSASG